MPTTLIRSLVVVLFASVTAFAADKPDFDVLITGGTVIDGSGAAGYKADVGIVDDEIVAIGPGLGKTGSAARTIDATGQVVAPGYIDVHTHADKAVLGDDKSRRAALNLLYQGITTINIGADGRHSRKYANRVRGQIAKQYKFLESQPAGMNIFVLLGHDNIRKEVMGTDDYKRFSTDKEMSRMAELVRRYMKEGALGMSLGLEYASGRYSDEEELVYLAKAVADYDRRGIIIAHERATGPQHRYYLPSGHNADGLYEDRFRKYPDGWDVIDYVKEGIRIAEQSGVVFDFTHFKITHQSYWGKAREIIDLIEEARGRGAKIYAEQIAFTNSGNSPMNLSLIPTKYYRGKDYSLDKLLQTLENPKKNMELRADIAWQIDKHGGPDSVELIASKRQPQWVGQTLLEIGQELGMSDPVDVVLEVKKRGDTTLPNGGRYRSIQTLSAEDIDEFVKQDWFGTVTDAGIYDLDGGFAQPRVFASFTNKITEFVFERKAITLEHAIRAGTGLPAEMLSLSGRGLLKEGYKADVQVFDPDALAVNARWTLRNSRAYSSGMSYVLVNGEFALDNGKPTFEMAGQVIRNKDAWKH